MKHVGLGLVSAVALTASLAAAPASAQAATVTSSASVRNASTTQASWRPAVVAKSGRVAAPRKVSTKRLIIRAVNRDVAAAGVPATQYSVERVRVARVNTTWAAARLTPKASAELDPATVVLRKTKGTWKVVDLGTAEVGCSTAPRKVVRGLGLTC